MSSQKINWDIVDKFPEDTVTCKCGAVFRSHARMVKVDGKLVTYLRKSCPKCGKNDSPRSVKSDPHVMEIG